MFKHIHVFALICLLFLGGCTVNEKTDNLPSEDDTPIITPTPQPTPTPEPTPVDETLVSCLKTTESGKVYIEVDGLPYNMVGAQIRLDGLLNRHFQLYPNAPMALSYSEIEEYFKKAKECGINTLGLSIDWKRIEVEKDVYEFELIDKLLEMTNKYDLKCEFLWFSTNMCGDTHSFHLPNYIFDDAETYSRYESKIYSENGMYGKFDWLVLNDPDLMERETLVLEKLMQHVYEWNLINGKKNPLIGMQIHNESDGLVRWRLTQKELKLNGVSVTPEQLWKVTCDALDNAGKAVKNSKYKIYTRCNMTVSYGVSEFPQWMGKNLSPLDVIALEGIDMVGDDPYVEDPKIINSTIKSYTTNGNYPHVAENMGNYASSPSLFLTTYQAGGSYIFYDFATPEYFVYMNKVNNSSYQMDQGLLNPDLSFKPHTQETINIINGINKMGSVLPTIDNTNFIAFNVLTSLPQQELTQTICTENLRIKYETKNGGIAYAIEHEEYLYVYSTTDCRITIENASFTFKADLGYFNGMEYVVESSETINPTVSVKGLNLYRIKIRNILEEVSSTSNDFV